MARTRSAWWVWCGAIAPAADHTPPGTQADAELVRLERLGEIVVGAGVHAFYEITVFRPPTARERTRTVRGHAAQPLADFDPVEAGHHPVEQRQPEGSGLSSTFRASRPSGTMMTSHPHRVSRM